MELLKKSSFLLIVLLLLFTLIPPKGLAEEGEVLLGPEQMTGSTERSIYFNGWNGMSFEDTAGVMVSNGIGFEPYYNDTRWMYADFTIEGLSFTTLETTISLENAWSKGARGVTGVEIYADDKVKLYSKNFENSTTAQSVELAIPAGTKYLSFYVIVEPGSQGNHGIIFENPRLTNKLPQKEKSDTVSLASIGRTGDSKDVYFGSWNGGKMVLSNGQIVTRAYGFEPYYNDTVRTGTSFFIGDYNHSTLETTISINKDWALGDNGKSEAVIYADNVKLYTKTFTNSTEQKTVKLRIPKGTKYLHLYGLFEKGSQGNHGIIFDNPVLSNVLEPLPADDTISLYYNASPTNKSQNNDVYAGQWGGSVFQLSDGYLEPWAYGLFPYYNGEYEAYATLYIGDYAYPTLETELSLDAKWKTGDRGKTLVTIYADSKVIYQSTMTNSSKTQKVIASIPRGTKNLQFNTSQTYGNQGHKVIFGNPRLTKRPAAPTVNKITPNSTSSTGKAQAGSTVIAKIGSKQLGKATADRSGNFSIKMAKQKAGTSISFTAVDSVGRESAPTLIKVAYEVSPQLTSKQVKVTNNKGKNDTVTVSGLKKGDTIKLYTISGRILGKSTASGSSATISVKQLGTGSGKVYITLQQSGKLESAKITVNYSAEKK